MANIPAAASGAFEVGSTWVGGVVPGSGDVAFANTFTVTISDTRTVQAISNAAGTGITVGGTFSLLNGCNLICTNANGVVQGTTATSCITTASLGVGSSASVAASANGVTTTPAILFSTAGTLIWAGNLTGSSVSSGLLFSVTGSGVLSVTGNLNGGMFNNTSDCMTVSGAATVTITGNATSGLGYAFQLTGLGQATITGVVTGGLQRAGVVSTSSGTLTVNGTCQSSTAMPAIAAGSATQITRLSGPFLLGANGNINPVQAQTWRWAPTQIPTYYEVATSGGSTKRNLYTADNMPVGGYPIASNVRQSTIYGPTNDFTGTLAVPSPSAVSLGVATDNTVGTAILTAANVRTAVGLASANLDTQFTNIPAAVWAAATRTLTTAIPTAADIATAVWSAATRSLTTAFPSVPTAADIASAVWSAVTRTLTSSLAPTAGEITTAVWSAVTRTITGGTVDTLTNAPTVPSAAAIATAVWAVADKTGYSLTSTERQAIATAVEQSILNEGDGQQVLNAIVGAIGNTNVDQVALIAAIRADIERSGGMLSGKSTLTAAQVWSNTTRTITGGTVDTLTNAPTVPSAAAIATAVWAAADKTGYSLTSTERQAIATAVEQSILNEGDGQAVLNAIVGAIGNTDVDQVALIAAIRADLERNGGMLAGRSTLTAAGVRTELKPELDRIANCSTIETTAVTIQDALSG